MPDDPILSNLFTQQTLCFHKWTFPSMGESKEDWALFLGDDQLKEAYI